jgi:nucleoside-diphosphate-sugar epimerase
VNSEEEPDWAREINVGGTKNLIQAILAQPQPPKLLFSSSFHIYGYTQDQIPPRKVTDLPQPVEHYAHHKVECERMVRESGLDWSIFRLAAALPLRLIMDSGMFDVALDNRIEFVHTRDVGLAIANALEIEEAWGKVWHIGGGAACQLTQRQLVESVLGTVGLGMLPEDAFPSEPYPTDWLDTTESQRVLKFQRYTLQDYLRDLRARLGFRRYFVWLLSPVIRLWLLSKSPLMAGRS